MLLIDFVVQFFFMFIYWNFQSNFFDQGFDILFVIYIFLDHKKNYYFDLENRAMGLVGCAGQSTF